MGSTIGYKGLTRLHFDLIRKKKALLVIQRPSFVHQFLVAAPMNSIQMENGLQQGNGGSEEHDTDFPCL